MVEVCYSYRKLVRVPKELRRKMERKKLWQQWTRYRCLHRISRMQKCFRPVTLFNRPWCVPRQVFLKKYLMSRALYRSDCYCFMVLLCYFSLPAFTGLFRKTLLDKIAMSMNNTVDLSKDLKAKMDVCKPLIDNKVQSCKSCAKSKCRLVKQFICSFRV